jgi:hypothetical protein
MHAFGIKYIITIQAKRMCSQFALYTAGTATYSPAVSMYDDDDGI